MPFDGTPTKPDLSAPTLEGLAWLLRHKEEWPEGFVWGFGSCSTCAMGVADKTWGSFWDTPGSIQIAATGAFAVGTYGLPSSRVTPEMVANRIDSYLTRTA